MNNRYVGNLIVLAPPTSEPVSLAQAKLQLAVDITDQDDQISDLITTARQLVELYTRRTLLPTTYLLKLGHFEQDERQFAPGFCGWDWDCSLGEKLYLLRPPLIAVTSVVYQIGNNSPVTLDPSTYTVDAGGEGQGNIRSLTSFPFLGGGNSTVSVTYQAGYTSNVPSVARTAIKLLVKHLFWNGVTTDPDSLQPIPKAIKRILGPMMWGSTS